MTTHLFLKADLSAGICVEQFKSTNLNMTWFSSLITTQEDSPSGIILESVTHFKTELTDLI